MRRSPRAQRWRLEVPWGEPARLTVPRSTSHEEVDRVLAEKRHWIAEQRGRQIPCLRLDRLAVTESEVRAERFQQKRFGNHSAGRTTRSIDRQWRAACYPPSG